MAAKIKCETVTIRVTDGRGDYAECVVPAYTVEPDILEDRIGDLARSYLEGSEKLGQPVSMGDFALWVILHAAQDPKEQ